jgi:hypothetical protein
VQAGLNARDKIESLGRGRTPMAHGNGRDNHNKGFSMWLAGGGIRGGLTHGATDELGYEAVKDVFHVTHLHATSCTQSWAIGDHPCRRAFALRHNRLSTGPSPLATVLR